MEFNLEAAKPNDRDKIRSNKEQEAKNKLFEAFMSTIRIRNLSSSDSTFNLEEHNKGGKVRQPFDLGLSRALFKDGQHQISIDSKLLSQLWKLCIENQAIKDEDDVLSSSLFEGYLEMKFDYTQSNKSVQLLIDSFSQSEVYAKKTDGVNMVKYQYSYECLKHDSKNQPKLSKKQLFKTCMDMAKRLKNANCETKFYQSELAYEAALDKDYKASNYKLSFEGDTQIFSPLDFMRLMFTFQADQITQKLIVTTHLLLPTLAFQFQPISSMKFNVAPLSKILLNKFSPGENIAEQSFNQHGCYSGFITLDSKNRVLPLMPNDPSTFSQKVCGLWIYGFEDVRAPYIWSACARFVFCGNFKDAKGSKAPFSGSVDQPTFLVILIDRSHRTQFFSMKVKDQSKEADSGLQWSILTHSQAIEREPNLFFKSYSVRDVFKTMRMYRNINDYMGDESRIKKVESLDERKAVQIPNVNQSQSHRQQVQQFSNRGRQAMTSSFKQEGNSTIEEKKASLEDTEEPQPMQLQMLPHQMKHYNPIGGMHLGANGPNGHNHNRQAVNRSRNSLSQNRLQQQQLLEVKQEPNESQTDEDDMVRVSDSHNIQIPKKEESEQIGLFHGTPRSHQLYIEQQFKIHSLEELVKSLQSQVQQLNEVVQNQQRIINEKNARHNLSGQTTAYQSRSPNSRYDSNNNPIQPPNQNLLLTGTFSQPQPFRTPVSGDQNYNSANYQPPAFDQVKPQQPVAVSPAVIVNNFFDLSEEHYQQLINLEAPSLISQPTGQFPLEEPSYHAPIEESLQVSDQTQPQLDFHPPQDEDEPLSQDSNSLLFTDQQHTPATEIPAIPDTKSMGDKRSRNKGKQAPLAIPIPHILKNQSNTVSDDRDEDRMIDQFAEIVQSQTMSEISNTFITGAPGGDSSNSRMKRSQSSALSTMGQEIKAMKSDLKQQYEEQIVSHRRPKGSRNVLNNNVVVPPGVNQNILAMKKKPFEERSPSNSDHHNASSSSDESDDDSNAPGRGDIDHTYNPYSFKKIEQAIFKKQPLTKPEPKKQDALPSQDTTAKIFVEPHSQEPQQHQFYKYGKTDWTMDLPKINYGDDEDEDDDSDDFKLDDEDDDNHQDRNHDLIKVEDISLKEMEPKYEQHLPKKKKVEVIHDSQSSDEDLEASSIAEVERKYLMMKQK